MLAQLSFLFPQPTLVVSYLLSGSSIGVAVTWALYAVFIFWAIYSLIAIYHWLKYSHASWIAFPSIVVHLLISFTLIAYALSGNGFFLSSYLP